ncbi:MAG TPA: T9SS type A sorting domain-containing protein, partial [Bacteroidia bacterium]|nr:T9SS type A sorting domain-containing protein [Bacteroidia bacterium]
VLTDEKGNFTVKLDTGVYRCEIQYAGYEKISRTIKVTKDEKADFALNIDPKSKYNDVVVTNTSHPATSSDTLVTKEASSSEIVLEDRVEMKTESVAVSADADLEEVVVVKDAKKKSPARSDKKKATDASPSYSWTPSTPSSASPSSTTTYTATVTDASGATSSGVVSYDKAITTTPGTSAINSWGGNAVIDTLNYGKLTAGEINDFSKWNLWTDLTKGELNNWQSTWNFAPTNRYMVQLKDQNGLPLANAKVELMNENLVIYTSRSDNTGKAELWESLKYDTSLKNAPTSIRVNYNSETKTIDHPKKFEKGINSLVFTTTCQQSANVDIAIVVDATGSMQDEINYLKSDLNNVIFKSKQSNAQLNMRFANVFYRDHEDAYLTQSQDFTRILSESVAFTNMHDADGGGDTPEVVEVALDSAINKLSWSEDTRAKILFLVLDASPHNTPEIQEKMRNLCLQAAEKGIRIVPVAGSGATKDTEYLMRCLALATNGTYVFLDDHSGIGNAHIKPSTDNYQVEILNDLLVRVIKSFTYMPGCNQQIADIGVNLSTSLVIVPVKNDSDTVAPSVKPKNGNDSLELNWKFYPNPTNGIINIVSNKNIPELYISDLSGKVLQVLRNIEPAQVVTVDLSEYSTGIYLIRYP